jgi:hypothetical protein
MEGVFSIFERSSKIKKTPPISLVALAALLRNKLLITTLYTYFRRKELYASRQILT